MNLIEKIKSRQNIDPIEIFDISDTKEFVENNYNAFVNEINQMKLDEQKRVEACKNKFDIELKNAVDNDTKDRLKAMKVSVLMFSISLFLLLPLLLMLLNINIPKYINILAYIAYITDTAGVRFIVLLSLLTLFVSCIRFIYTTNKANYKDNQKKAEKKYITTKDIGSLTDKIHLYILILMELTEICKLFNNSELKQSEIVSNILALKTNYEARKFQQEILNKKEQEVELQRKIAEYNRQQMESQQRQERYAKQQLESQRNQEEYTRQQNQVIQEEKMRRERLRRGY